MKEGDLFIHNKTGDVYELLIDRAIRCDNGFEGEEMVVYEKYYAEGEKWIDCELYVRSRKEFLEKFTKKSLTF